MKKYSLLWCLIFVFSANPAWSAVDSKVQNQLHNLIEKINIAAKAKDFDALISYLPPHLLSSMSLRLGKTQAQLREDFKANLVSQLQKDSSAKYQLSEDNIVYAETKYKQLYALIKENFENKQYHISRQTLALYEGNHWYIIYGGQKTVQNPIFTAIYPALTAIDFKPMKIEKK